MGPGYNRAQASIYSYSEYINENCIAIDANTPLDASEIGRAVFGESTQYNVKISVENVFRGEEAWVLIKAADIANPPPKEGFEYLLTSIRVACSAQSGSSSIFYTVESNDFKVYDPKG